MDSIKRKNIIKDNGKIVMQTLKTMKSKPTLMNISRQIADDYLIPLDKAKLCSKQILYTALNYGFLTRKMGKYYITGAEELKRDVPQEAASQESQSDSSASSSEGDSKTNSSNESSEEDSQSSDLDNESESSDEEDEESESSSDTSIENNNKKRKRKTLPKQKKNAKRFKK